ncbi:FAD-binding oxidoreductase [Dechloromonas denitrificans]|uniref:FAD-binding oxidoreductase n=1 Tax=Dechloromonas denitrificans TaxID=281362 RepID=UPI001CF8082C|nr:FAD-linked oxidase C-terminal domain-containing protein [Dechloromonas denitrificans]UCV03991.1 FAD-binding protein [Dechloromonas denitrificans]UCV08253.1 FAD-binding protein [Dechloromonas denitrificans]
MTQTTLPDALSLALSEHFQQRFSRGESTRLQHGRDESVHHPQAPDGVVMAESTDEVVLTLKLCAAHGVPVIPYGVGSSVEGHVLAPQGGISLDLSSMNQVLAIHAEDGDATVQAGVTRKQLNDALKGSGLFFPIDPGADATLGGMAATRASGTNAVRYGTMRDNVMATTTVLADGRVMQTGGRARKSSAGYDLTRLLVGSEGTLGIMTELTVKLYPIPEAISAAVCTFPDIDSAVQTVIQTIQLGIPVARIELLDALSLKAINLFSKTTLSEAPTLFFEFHGSPASVAEQAETVQAIADELGGANFAWATHPEDRSRLWQARHDAYFACLQLKPGCRCFPTDVCVPISRLAECIAATNEDIAQVGIPIALFGHVGDGNFHLVVLVDTGNDKEMAEAAWISQRVVERAIAMEGTCTGEHGIGLGKRKYLPLEHGEVAVDVMRAIKQALDPKNLMNPGKILPPQA